MVNNMGDVEQVQSKSEDIRDGAEQFKRGAKSLENEMKARNRRLNIIIIVVVIAVVLYLLIPVIIFITKLAEEAKKK